MYNKQHKTNPASLCLYVLMDINYELEKFVNL